MKRYMVVQQHSEDCEAIRWLVIDGPDEEQAAHDQIQEELNRETAPWHGDGDDSWVAGTIVGFWPADFVIQQLQGPANITLPEVAS